MLWDRRTIEGLSWHDDIGGGGVGRLGGGDLVAVIPCRTARIGRRDVLKEKELKKVLDPVATPIITPRRRSSSSAVEDSDQYGLSQLFQPDNAPRGMTTVPEEEDGHVRSKFKVAHFTFKILHDDNYMMIS
jgi:hypothetical protein